MPGEEATQPSALGADASTIAFYLPPESSRQGALVRMADTQGQQARMSSERRGSRGRGDGNSKGRHGANGRVESRR